MIFIVVNNVTLPSIALTGNRLFLVGIRDWTDFDTKKRVGSVYTVVCPEKDFEKVEVKIQDAQPAINLDKTAISEANLVGQFISVELQNGMTKLFTSFKDKQTKMTFTAEGIRIVSKGDVKQ